jgi:C1A family cysteine protease
MRYSAFVVASLLCAQSTLALAQSKPAPAFTPQEPTYTTGPYPTDNPATKLSATIIPADFAVTARVQAAVAQKITSDPQAPKVGANVSYREGCNPKAASYDYRTTGAIQPPKDQNPCGSCYVFSAAAAYEASWYLQNKAHIRVSEQQILDCAKSGDCDGGFHTGVFDFAKQKGFVKEDQYRPYTASAGKCDVPSGPYSAANWSTVYGKYGTPNPAAIKEALCVHGPVVAAMYATDQFLQYKTGVFNEFPVLDGDSDINHDVLIIGWDDEKLAWLIENSWGPNWWGDKGFGWIRYQTNNIGFGAAWIDAIKLSGSSGGSWGDISSISGQAKALNSKAIEQVATEILKPTVIKDPGQILGSSHILGGPNSAMNQIFKNRF